MEIFGKDRINIVRSVVIVGFACSVIYHYVLGNYLGYANYWETTFLFKPSDKFNDFFNVYRETMDWNPYKNQINVYFPFAFVPVLLLTCIKIKYAFMVFIGGFLLFLSFLIFRYLPETSLCEKLTSLFVLVFMSYPVLFAIDRGNLECLLFIFTALFVHYYRKGDDIKSACFLSCAIAMKAYSGVFCVLFLADRKYRSLLLTLLLVAVLTLASASILEGGVVASYFGLKANLARFNLSYIVLSEGLQHNSSLYAAIMMSLGFLLDHDLIRGVYPYLAVAIFAFAAAYLIFVEKELWKRIAMLTFMTILLPQVSSDYKLIHIIIPLLLFLDNRVTSRFPVVFSLLFGLLLIPKDYAILAEIAGPTFYTGISSNGILNALLMMVFIVLIVVDRRKEPAL